MGTNVCAALTDHQANNRRSAGLAGLPGTTVHAKIVLKITAAVHPIQAGAIVTNALIEDRLYGLMQAVNFT